MSLSDVFRVAAHREIDGARRCCVIRAAGPLRHVDAAANKQILTGTRLLFYEYHSALDARHRRGRRPWRRRRSRRPTAATAASHASSENGLFVIVDVDHRPAVAAHLDRRGAIVDDIAVCPGW